MKEAEKMSPKDWEQRMIDAYYDYSWRRMLEPPCETFKAWKADKIGYAEVNQAIEGVYREKCALNNLVSQRYDRTACLIQVWDREWFDAWIKEHRPSAGAIPDCQPTRV